MISRINKDVLKQIKSAYTGLECVPENLFKGKNIQFFSNMKTAPAFVPANRTAKYFPPQEEETATHENKLYEVLNELKNIREEKIGESIGLRPHTRAKDKIDILVGEKAEVLIQALTNERTNEVFLEEAMSFIDLLEVIEELQGVAKERKNPKMGFKVEEVKEEDKALGTRAEELAISLILDPNKKVIKKVESFFVCLKVIETLEDIAYEKSKRETIGFLSQDISELDEKIGKKAEQIADMLKLNPSKKNLILAYKLFQAVKVIDNSNTIEKIKKDKGAELVLAA